MKNLKYAIPYIIVVVFEISCAAANEQLIEVCDIEGSSCPDDTHCCEQSICETASTEILKKVEDIENKPKTRCCDKVEREKIPPPDHCIICTRCCNKDEREKIPPPDHCSKCPPCGEVNEDANTTDVNGLGTTAAIVVAVLVVGILGVSVVLCCFWKKRQQPT